MKQVNKFLAFVCVIRDEIFSENRGIMDYNLTLFKDSVRDILLASQMSNNISLNQTGGNNTNLISNINNSSSQDTSSNLTSSLAANLSLNGGSAGY
jgi:hypothetical protein